MIQSVPRMTKLCNLTIQRMASLLRNETQPNSGPGIK